jgi:tetratricopeptide (TPR) repeat protein
VKDWHRQRHLNHVEGERHLKARNWTEAETHLRQAIHERKRPPKQKLDLLVGLMEAQRKQGKFADAAKTMHEATALAEASKDRVLQVKAFDAQADFQLDQKDYSGAEQTLGKLEALESASKAPDYKRIASSARKLGTALLNSGRMDEAMKSFDRAAELSEKAFGANHLETGDALTELGARYRELGNHAEAQRCLRKALAIHRETSGLDSHQTTHDLFHLASSLAESGNVEAAAAEYEKVLALRERQIGADRTQTAETQARLASIYVKAGRTSAARELLIHAIGTLDRKGGDERLEFALETMAQVEDSLNHTAEAEQYRERAAHSLATRTGQAEAPAEPVKQLPKYY